MNELNFYIHLIFCLMIYCIGSVFLGILDGKSDKCKFSEWKKFKEENKYNYIIGYILSIMGLCFMLYDLIYLVCKYYLIF